MANSAKKILIATRNPAKFAELQKMLSVLPYEFVSLTDVGIDTDVEETEPTFVGNALLKAKTYAQLSGLPTIADDGGLAIDALSGWPGVYSARVAKTDAEKIKLALQRMHDVPNNKRTAQFVGVLAYVEPNGFSKIFEATLSGMITNEPRGTLIPGFPYRTIFLISEFNKTMTELDAANINYLSHRQKTVNLLIDYFLKING